MINDAARGRPPRSARPASLLLAAALLARTASSAEEPTPRVPLAGRLSAAVASAQRLVSKVRGVPFPGVVPSAVLHARDLPALLEKKLAEDLPVPFDRYAESLDALGLIENEPGLEKRINGLYARQVAGFYDPSEGKFYVVAERSSDAAAGTEGLGPAAAGLMEEVLLTHELTHALQDRRLGLDKRMKGLKDSSDALFALECFLEGEATVVMAEALASRLPEEARGLLGTDTLSQMMAGLSSGDSVDGAEGVPEFFVKELLFPYVAGTAWVQKKKAAGGWAAVDAAYARLPETTSEILHPDRTPGPRSRLGASDTPGPKDLPPGSRMLYADCVGEWALKTLLERASLATAGSLAADWQDDRIVFFESGEGARPPVGFLWRIRTSAPPAARRLADALSVFHAGRPSELPVSVKASGDVVTVARGRFSEVPETAAPPGAR